MKMMKILIKKIKSFFISFFKKKEVSQEVKDRKEFPNYMKLSKEEPNSQKGLPKYWEELSDPEKLKWVNEKLIVKYQNKYVVAE